MEEQRIDAYWLSALCRAGSPAASERALPARKAILGRRYRLQWVVRYDGARPLYDCVLRFDCALAVRAYRVRGVPNELPTYGDGDDWTERRDPGLYADPLLPVGGRTVITPGVDNVFLIEVETTAAGAFGLGIRLEERGAPRARGEWRFDVEAVPWAGEDWIYTDWIHYDAIAREHGAPLFGDEFYRVFDSYLELYRESGGNMLMVPAFTPSLDTEIGGERTTAQLIGITERDGEYAFDYGEFDRFVDFVTARGVRYLEFPPLVSQWTGEYAPKFAVGAERGMEERFGWAARSDDPAYLEFLDRFLASLGAHLQERGRLQFSWFHLSDEPDAANARRVARVERIMRTRLAGARFFDTVLAESAPKPGFLPVYALESADARIAEGERVRAVYYCCEQCRDYVSNRFLCMPLARCAVIGAQMAALGGELLLHWGFNFYNEVLSRGPIDPYGDSTAGGNYPGGDAFIVYPDRARGGALPSLRLFAMAEAHDLYRLTTALHAQNPAQAAALIEAYGLSGYRDRPQSARELTALREQLIAALSSKADR